MHLELNGRLGSFFSALSRLEWSAWRAERTEYDFWTNYGWLITTSAAMIGCYVFNIQNAGAFLLLAVIHSLFIGGWKIALASAGLSTVFSAIFLSIPGQLFHYTEQEARSLTGISVACFGAVFLVMYLRRSERAALLAKAERIRKTDITRESERLFEEMADSAPVLLWLADTEGRRYFFNAPWLSITGKSLEEQMGDGWLRSVHPDDRENLNARYSNAVKSSERLEIEYRVLGADGEYRWIQDTALPRIGPDGENWGYIGACMDRSERKRVESALHQLSGRLLELQDDERRRISRELHDTTAQNLAVLSMSLCAVKDATKILGFKTRSAVAECLSIAEQCSQEIRTLSYLLHPPLLDELGLDSALRSYTAGFTRRTGIRVELKMADIGRLPIDVETTLFRIVQEALTNVHRHSGSQKAEIRVIRDPKEVKLVVSDEGRGVPPRVLELLSDGANLGVGIAGMRERASQLGGQLKIASGERGTTITATLPLRDRQ
jgi:PAS domain S-box-containing protein